MKQLFLNGQPTTVFFNEERTLEEIVLWIEKQMEDTQNLFNLNEAHSCKVMLFYNTEIRIIGDEDYEAITLEKVVPQI